jgi:hypothetical protein
MNEETLFSSLDFVVDEASFIFFVEALVAERRTVETLSETSDGFRGEWQSLPKQIAPTTTEIVNRSNSI